VGVAELVEADVGYALMIFGLLNLLDWFVTHYALRRGAVEANPVARLVYERFGTVGLYSFKQVVTGVMVFFVSVFGGLGLEATLWAWNIVLALVVAWNSFVMLRITLSRGGS